MQGAGTSRAWSRMHFAARSASSPPRSDCPEGVRVPGGRAACGGCAAMDRRRQATLLNLMGLVGACSLILVVAREVVVDGPRRQRVDSLVQRHELAASACRREASRSQLPADLATRFVTLADWHSRRSD